MDEGRQLWSGRRTRSVTLFGSLLVLAANAPLAIWVRAFWGRGAGDARTHARIADAIARHGLPHGWTDAYGGGFPVGPHYPGVGWALGALLIRVGFAPYVAIDLIAAAAVLAVPVLAFVLAVRAGARPFAALTAALVLSWVAPGGYFTSGCEAYFGLGLLSQVLCVPCVVLFVAAVATEGPPRRAVLWAVLAVLCHPQIAVAAAAVLLVPVVASRRAGVVNRYARAELAAVMVALAVYGRGIATLKVPFGWPPMATWKSVGFGTERLGAWLVGGLLDVGRAPVLTALWGGALLLCAARLSRPAARAAVAASTVTLVLAVSGTALTSLGGLGQFLLSFLQPLRVMALIPLAAAGAVLVALEESAPAGRVLLTNLLRHAPERFARSGWAPRVVQALAIATLTAAALPSRVAVALLVRDKTREILASFPPDSPCRPGAPAPVDAWVASLAGGRLWYDDATEAGVNCEFSSRFDLASSVPVAVTSGAGAHVGVHQVAFHQVAPDRQGSAQRAEALGVRHVLLFSGAEPTGPGWRVARRAGSALLAEREGGDDVVGAGCITTIWEGSDEALRRRMYREWLVDRAGEELLDPHAFVALHTLGDRARWSARPADLAGCDASGAVVRETPREPGAYEAEVETPSPVDVVIRAAAFPTWRIEVDGRPTEVTNVAPGFPTVRVAAGRHRVEAVVGTLPGYAAGILLALLGSVLCALRSPWARLRRRVNQADL